MSMDTVIIGRLVADAETKVTEKTGKVIHIFTVASNRGFGDKQETDYCECMAFAPLLDKQVEHLLKGCMVKVCGHFQTRKVKNGDKTITYWNCIVSSLEMLWGKKKSEEPQGSVGQAYAEIEDNDIPF